MTVIDGEGGTDSEVFTLTVTAVNDAPVADDLIVSTDEEASLGITLTGSDVEGTELTYLVVIGPSDGDLSGTAPDLIYAPDENFNGEDSFTYTVSDGELTSPEATVFNTVNPVNDIPVLDAIDNQTTDEDTDLTIDLSASDVDINTDGQTLSFSATSSDESLVLVNTTSGDGTGSGTLIFDIQADQNGSATVTVTVTDSEGGSDSARKRQC